MKTNFRLVEPNKIGSSRIYVSIWKDNKRAKYYPGLNIPHSKLWDRKKQKALLTKSYTYIKLAAENPKLYYELEELNSELIEINSQIKNYKDLCRQSKIKTSSKGLREYLKENHRGLDKSSPVKYLTEYMEKVHLQGMKDGSITFRKGNEQMSYALGTIKSFSSSVRVIKEYEEILNKKLRFNEIDLNFHADFIKHFYKKGRKTNYIGRLIKDIRSVLEYTYEKGYHDNNIFKSKKFYTPVSEVDEIYLTEIEIERIRTTDLPESLKHYRDVFLVGCYTGLRFSDYSRVDSQHITEDGRFIEIITQKTKTKILVPIKQVLKDILSQPNFLKRKAINATVLNRKLKEIGKMAGIDNPIEEKVTINQQSVIRVRPKYEKIKTHTARRSAATNWYLAGLRPIEIMALTGHKSEKSLLNYIKASQFERAQRLAEHEWFKSELKIAN
jgi:integrase